MVTIEGKTYDFESIKTRNYSSSTPLEKSVFDFLHDWWNEVPYFIQKTSGSTGVPKEIKISREQMIWSANNTIQFLKLNAHTHSLICLPIEFIAGKMMIVRSLLHDLHMHIILPSSSPFSTYTPPKSIEFIALLPLQLQNSLPLFIDKINGCHHILLGGAPVPITLELACQNIDSHVYHSYGMTETVSHIALRNINGPNHSPYFTLLPGNEIELTKNSCLRIKSFVTHDTWIETQDIVELIDKKTFKWSGRIDDVINSGGLKLFIPEIEEKTSTLLSQVFDFIPTFYVFKKTHLLYGETANLMIECDKNHIESMFDGIKKLWPALKKNYIKEVKVTLLAPYSASGKLIRKDVPNAQVLYPTPT